MNSADFIILTLLLLSVAFMSYWRYWFCRKPKRNIPKEPKSIISPANGRVAVIKQFSTRKVKAKKWNKASVEILCQDVAQEGWFILIVMTPLNVHYQRAPIAGNIERITYTPGKFLNAVNGAAKLHTLKNERNEILMKGKYGRLKVVQIAGFLARRIDSYTQPKQKVEKGEEIGFINFGSQVALILPKSVKLKIEEGELMIDGESVIGTYR